MYKQIEVGTQGVLSSVFPRLKTMTVNKIVHGLPVVVDFITIKDGTDEGWYDVRKDENIVCRGHSLFPRRRKIRDSKIFGVRISEVVAR